MGIASGIVASGGTTTTDATAEQWHIKSGKTAYIASGKVTGNAYTPAMMELNGTTGYYSKTAITTSGTKVNLIGRIKTSPVAALQVICYMPRSSGVALYASVVASNDPNNPNKLNIICQNGAGGALVTLYSDISVTDGAPYTFFFEYDSVAGTAQLIINGSDADNTGATGRVLTTGTLNVGSSTTLGIGATDAGAYKFAGQIGFVGIQFVGGLDWADFMRSDGSPIYQDPASSWAGSGFGAQPLFFNPHGDMVNNLGSAGAMTKNGTINVGDGGT